ncbi:MAG: Pup--protein ligase [Actinomycetota bacterium]|nr:Pup--protein ligase [Actinomycetota bacterium]
MERRIFGLENEYGVTCTWRGQRRLSPDEVARYLFRRVVSWGRSSNVFLRNGARLYLDVGSHPEYATPECDSAVDLVTHDKAGERILEGLLVDAERRLREEGIAGDIYLFKNNTDSAGNSYGCHENYLVGRHGEFSRLADVLIPFLVSRQLMTGAGKVLQTPRGAVYCVSQRAEHIWEGVSSATTRSRPIINTRDEPHADAEKYRRLHVIIGDANLAELSTYLKVGTTSLVLAMIEAHALPPDLALEEPVEALQAVSHDPTLTHTVRLRDGRRMTAIELQWVYLEQAQKFVERSGGDDEQTRDVLRRWAEVLDDLAADPMRCADRLDWPAKLRLLEGYRARDGLSWGDSRLQLVDLQYSDVRAEKGLYNRLVARGSMQRLLTDDEVARAMTSPPSDTRAFFRGECVRRYPAQVAAASWDSVVFDLGRENLVRIPTMEPLRGTRDHVGALFEASATAQELVDTITGS